jgi:hypothetical protein
VNTSTLRRQIIVCFQAVAFSTFRATCLKAQTNSPTKASQTNVDDKTAQRLQTQVHLNLGRTTVQTVIAALSTQTGLPINAEEYLQPRKLIVQLDGITAQGALDTLVELNDWRWFRKEDGQIWLTRHRAVVPQTLVELPAALRANLPKDYRAFFGIGMATKDLPERIFIAQDGTQQRQPNLFPVLPQQERSERGNLVVTRLNNLSRLKSQQMFAMFQPLLAEGKTLSWTTLTLQEQADIHDTVLLGCLCSLCRSLYVELLDSGLTPYEADMDGAELQLEQGNGFMIGHALNGSYMGFGVAIPGLPAIAPRLPTLKNPLPAQEATP